MTPTPNARELRLHGDCADDFVYLRDVCGFLVAPFRDGYRLNNDVVTRSELQQRAALERQKRPAPKPRADKVAAADPVADCQCGKPINHYGRCWVRRGMSGPPSSKRPSKSSGGVESRHAAEAGKARDQRAATPAGASVGSAVSGDRVSADGPMQPSLTVPKAGVAPGPLDTDIAARLDRVEQRMNDFFRLLAIAVGGRRQSLEQLIKGLVDIETELSTNQRSQ